MDNTFVRDNQHDRYPVAVHVILTNPTSGHVLLMRRDGTGYGRNKLAFVAGHVDLGEKVTDCAVRETAEEIGVRIDADDRIPAGVMFRRSAEFRVDFYFSVSRWTGHPQICEPHKCTELVWAALDEPASRRARLRASRSCQSSARAFLRGIRLGGSLGVAWLVL